MAAATNNVADQLVVQSSPEQETSEQSNSNSSDENCRIKCANCDQIFTPDRFEEHVCEYDEKKKRIASRSVLDNHPCFKQIEENIEQWKKLTRKGKVESDAQKRNRRSGDKNYLRQTHDCSHCERKFVHASGLTRHIANRHREKLEVESTQTATPAKASSEPFKVCLKCLQCGIVFGSVDKMMEHFEEVDWEKEFEQYDGAYMNEGKLSLRKATRVVILTTVFQCEFCEKHFADLPSLYQHESLHDPLITFECSLCEIKIPYIKDTLYHRQSECVFRVSWKEEFQNLSKYFACNVCDEVFGGLAALYEHRYGNYHLFPRITKANNDDPGSLKLSCELCGIVFDNADTIFSHHAEMHVPKRPTTLGIRRHVAEKPTVASEATAPSLSRPYLCELCGKTYTQSSHLWQHLRFHKGIRPFTCPEVGCNRSFTIRPDLKDHIRKCHTGERPYHCDLCDKRFLTGSVYYQHRLIHRGERRYGCDECGKRFYRADALKNHQRIHSGEKPYSCSYCDKNFRQRGDREKHIRVKHSNTSRTTDIGYGKAPSAGRTKEAKIRKQKQRGLKQPINRTDQASPLFIDEISLSANLFKPILNDIDML